MPLAEGLPLGWTRAGRMEAVRDGIADGVFYPALHGTTHFCRSAVERNLIGKANEPIFCGRFGGPGRHTFTGACRGSGMNTGIRSSLKTNDSCPQKNRQS